MTNQDNKPKNDLGLFAGTKPSPKRDGNNPKYDPAGKKGDKGGPGQPGQQGRQGNPGQPGPDSAGVGNKRYRRANAGWLFYKEYYHDIPFRPDQVKDELKPFFEAKNRVITARQLMQYREEVEILQGGFETMQWFEMTTVYPGMVTGLGSPHETHREGEYKLGFHFDHTTGLPVIPGSSVKGALRAAFKKTTGADDETGYRYIQWILQEIANESGSPVELITIEQVKALEKEIFEGEGLRPYQRDVFLDAVIVSSKNEDTLILADDFITPHGENVFKEPNPLQFLKILPQVTFRFRFRLRHGVCEPISVKMKMDLFKRILEDLGIGAKTNVGYGKLKDTGESKIDEKNFSYQNLEKANFSGVHVEDVNFRYANLREANFNKAYIKDADFSFANLEGVSLGEIRQVQNLAFNPAGTWLAAVDTAGYQGKVKIWDIADGRELYTFYTGSHRTSKVVFSPDGAFLAADNNSDKKIIIYHISNNWKSFELRGHSDDINCLTFHPNSTVLATGSDDKTVKTWDLKSRKLISTYTGHKEDIKAVSFSPDGKWIASSDNYFFINIWDMKTEERIRNFSWGEKNDYTFGDITLIFSPNGRLLVVSSDYSETIHLFEIHADWKQTTLKSKGDVKSLCFNSDGNYLLAATSENLQWWDMRSLSVIRDIKLNDSGSFFVFSYDAKRIAVGIYSNKIDILELESGNKILTIQQELHCVRTNIFGVTGLREDQRDLMLKRGAVEVDTDELKRTGEKVGPYIRRQRFQELVANLKEGYKRKRIPAVLILGPGTFLPPLNLRDKDDRYFFDRFDIPFSIKKEMSAEEWNDRMDHFYYEMLKEGRYYYRENRWREKSGKMNSRNLELLRQNYNSLVHLVNEGIFPIVIDMDIFSELNREMFGIEPLKESYRDMEDLDYSFRQLSRDMEYLDKGRGFYFKVFSEEDSYNKRYMMRDEKDPERFFYRMFEEIFHKIFYRYEKELQVVWMGFWPRHIMRDMPFRRMERGQSLYWVVDESLRENLETEYIEATFLDYPVGKFSDFFYDLHRELEFDDRDLMIEVPIGISELKSSVYSDSVEKRLEAARALPARAASPLASRKTLHMQEDLFNRLLHDSNLEVRQTLLREIINRIEQLPPDINTIIEGFSEDKDDSVRADIAAWIIGQYDRFGKEYESILLKLAKDRSQYVRATIINTIKKRFEKLPSHIRQLASQLVGTGLVVEMVRGGGMLMDTPTELTLRVTNHGLESISETDIEILISAEYNVESNNPVILTQLEPEAPAQVTFTIRPKFNHRIPINYKVRGELQEPPLFVNVIRDNPYIYGNPIDSGDSFFGRQQELVDIVQAVSKPNKQDILLVGERRTGKSSLFYQILKHLNPPFFPVYIVLNEAPDKADSVVSFICGKVIRFFIERLALPTEPWNNFKCSSLGLTDNLKTILDAAHKTKPDLKLVLLLDEADFILKVEDRLQNLMRAAFQSLEVGSVVRAIVAGTTDLSTYVSQRSSPFFNHFRFVCLKPLGDSETLDLITKPAESLGYTYETAAIKRIAKACGGHPYYCQRICYEAFLQSIKAKHPIITHAQAESAVRKVIQEADAYNGFITGFWKAAPPRQPLTSSQKKFLKNLANGKSTAKVKKSEIQRLLDWQLVKECNGDYRFTCELFEEWTKQAPLR